MSMKESLWKYLMGFFLLVLLLLPFVCLRAEEAQSFGMGLDYASFRDYADTTHSYVEIYYSFNRRELTFVPQEKGLMATGE